MGSSSAVTKVHAIVVMVIIIVAALVVVARYMMVPTPPPTAENVFRRSAIFPAIGTSDPAIGSFFQVMTIHINLYDPLVHPALPYGVEPHVAESWEISEDYLTYTFHIRKGIKFHDGSELTAEDVAFSMDRMIALGQGLSYQYSPYIERSTVLDDYTVQFKLKKRIGPFLDTLIRFFIINKDLTMAHIKSGAYGDYGDYGQSWLVDHDAGSGAYKTNKSLTEEGILMERFEDYWGEMSSGAPEEIWFGLPTEPVALKMALARGNLDMSNPWQSQETFEALDDIQGVDMVYESCGNGLYLMMHCRKPPTDDIHFRKAIAWAFDYDEFCKLCPGYIQMVGPIPRDIPGHIDVFQYHQDLEKAIEELKQSKYYGNLDEYPVEFHYFVEDPQDEKIGLLFLASMADIGIPVTLVKKTVIHICGDMSKMETSANIYPMTVPALYAEAGNLFESRYHSSSASSAYQNEWLLNETIDAMIEDAQATINRTERYEKWGELQEIIVDMCPSIFCADFALPSAYQTYLSSPLLRGEPIYPILGYNFEIRYWTIDLEKKAEALKG